jgi:hypothetical protein
MSVESVSAPGGLVDLARRPALSLRVFVWRSRLDDELAAGADPGARPALALRAAQLVHPRHRRKTAACVERLVEDFDADRGWWFSAAIPFLRDQVADARGTLLSLAEAVRAAERVEPRGMALLSRLLRDPASSPLYVRTARGALELKAQTALAYLVGERQARPGAGSATAWSTRGGSHGGD